MYRHEGKFARLEAQSSEHATIACCCAVLEERVDHDIPDEVNALLTYAFPHEMFRGRTFGCEEQICHLIREDPVDFLRHRPVKAAKAGFDVGYRNLTLGRDQRAGQG